MMTKTDANTEVSRWKPALLAELKRQATAAKVQFEEVSTDLEYFKRLPDPAYIFRIGDALIVGVANDELGDPSVETSFIPSLVVSEVADRPGRIGYPHNMVFGVRRGGVPAFKAVVKRALLRAGVASSTPKPPVKKPAHQPAQCGKGYLITKIADSTDVILHVGTLRLTKEAAERVVVILDESA